MNIPDIIPSVCPFTWRLHGETREVQCAMDFGHPENFHQVGWFVHPGDGAS